MQFSLLFFSQVARQSAPNPYRLLTEATVFGDEAGFEGVWIPERHFDENGGLYPNPAVVAASLAPRTSRIRLRAGSVVLPLHHPAEVVEAWSVVDQLSGGRVEMAFASGWSVNDFILSPGTYHDRRAEWISRLATVRELWEGRPVSFLNGAGEPTPVRVFPRPVQPRLRAWLAISRSVESFRIAGELGVNVLTMLSGITLEQLRERTEVYRQARRAAGHDAAEGVVTLMLHTYVHEDARTVELATREPLLHYLRTSARSHLQGGAVSLGRAPSDQEIERMAEFSLERYRTTALLGDVESTKKKVVRMRAAGVDEVACMIDFGPTFEEVMASLPYLASLRASCADA